MKQALELLIAKADSLLTSVSDADTGEYLAKLDEYVEAFNKWQEKNQTPQFAESFGALSEAAKQELKELAEKLNTLHHKIIEMSSSIQDLVTAQLVDLHKREKVLKSYIDQYPSRITIAGKRKG